MTGTATRTHVIGFRSMLRRHGLESTPRSVTTLWVNLTRRCNQSCTHCHVAASPERTEQMSPAVMERCLGLLKDWGPCRNLDLTGGAPELHPAFEQLVTAARALGKHVIVRHNLTITADGDCANGVNKTHLPEFFAAHGVEVLASLPHYTRAVTDSIRGRRVFLKSIAALQRLNEAGYARPGSGLVLNIVHNHDGPISPEERQDLEDNYRRHLRPRYGIEFNCLLAVTNMPVNRFREGLEEEGAYAGYMERLTDAFSPSAVDDLVCRNLISVGYDGRLYDCDFNQMLGLQIRTPAPMTVFNADPEGLLHRRIRFGRHCFGCTAGGGSS